MQIISHRGYWHQPSEKNTRVAFERSFTLGFGTETDVRDALLEGEPTLVISHDVPRGGELLFSDMIAIAKEHGSPLLALNIKSDGLSDLLQRELAAAAYDNYFLFDHSVPDLIQCERRRLNCFTRLSEFEPHPPLYEASGVVGVWVDAFLPGRWYDADLIKRILDEGKHVALVAPDLHHRNEELGTFLAWVTASGLSKQTNLVICTDLPELARDVLTSKGNEV
ncbi:phosphodiesterase [Ensifer sp. SL37]|uniref:phosphodiesterase n=1 Tax=Ensifer sp. SL37 TaxID=2995137 RepID=UPI0022762C34|nr:phosphodiesterase [Ensifer sp. SL37]MCY1740374.1 phosphodiesterase [Ensifer sp. SL37]